MTTEDTESTERATPETDAAQCEGLLRTNPIPMQVVTANFARKLERERDEAREVFREMWQSGDAFLPHVDPETTTRWRKAVAWLSLHEDQLKRAAK